MAPVRKKQLTRPFTDLEKVLGHRVSEQEQAYYDKDIGKKGYTLAGHNYEGPGNSLQAGDPVDNSDEFARRHDIQYFDTQWRYNEGELTREQAEREVRAEDREAEYYFDYEAEHGEPLAGTLGNWGLSIKNKFEDIFGHQYPDFPNAPKKHVHITPDRESYFANEDEIAEEESRMNPTRKRTDPGPSSSTNEATPPQVPRVSTAHEENITSNRAGGTPVRKVQSQTISGGQEGDIEMAPGDAGIGTAKDQAGAPMAAGAMMKYEIERPISLFGHKRSIYKKCHKFMTFGYADSLLGEGSTAQQRNRFWATHLAEIPWHIPAFYLNQSEFDLIPNGSKVVRMHISVKYRGATIQFVTNQSSADVAVLNQIQDISYAHGLNRTGWGYNGRYTGFNMTEPMIVTSFSSPVYGEENNVYIGMVRDYYGRNNSQTGFASEVPHHQAFRQTFLYNYWVTATRNAITATGTNTDDMLGGWPCLAEKVHQCDGKTAINTVITESEYKPKMGMLKQPHRWQPIGLPMSTQGGANQSLNIPVGGHLVDARQAVITTPAATTSGNTVGMEANANEADTVYSSRPSGTNTQQFNIFTPIEKSQWAKSGFWGEQDPHIQPSVHIGVQPIPALLPNSSTSAQPQFDNWTTTRGYWEVTATMEVDEYNPTARPYATVPNVAYGEQVVMLNDNARPANHANASRDGATRGGLYCTQFAV